MDKMLSFNDVEILRAIVSNSKNDGGGFSLVKGRTASYVQKETNLSISKVRKTLAKYVQEGYLVYGVRTKDRQFTYVISEKGMELLSSLIRSNVSDDEEDTFNF